MQANLLLVDPSEHSRRMLEVSLRKEGFYVSGAGSRDEAIRRLSTTPPDLIIADAQLPEDDGFNFCRLVKSDERHARIPVIILGRDAMPDEHVQAVQAGADEYLPRPVFIKEIVVRIKMLLDRQKAATASQGGARAPLAGSLADMPVVDLVQLVDASRASAVLRLIDAAGKEAMIWFREGKIIDAELGRLSAAPAVFRVLLWTAGRFEVDFRETRRRDVLGVSNETLLAEGMKRLEQWSQLLEQIPHLDAVFAVDYGQLAERLGDIPDEFNPVLRLFDGRRTLTQVVDDSALDDIEALSVVSQLYFDGLIYDASSPSGQQLSVAEMPELGAGASGSVHRRPTPVGLMAPAASARPTPAAVSDAPGRTLRATPVVPATDVGASPSPPQLPDDDGPESTKTVWPAAEEEGQDDRAAAAFGEKLAAAAEELKGVSTKPGAGEVSWDAKVDEAFDALVGAAQATPPAAVPSDEQTGSSGDHTVSTREKTGPRSPVAGGRSPSSPSGASFIGRIAVGPPQAAGTQMRGEQGAVARSERPTPSRSVALARPRHPSGRQRVREPVPPPALAPDAGAEPPTPVSVVTAGVVGTGDQAPRRITATGWEAVAAGELLPPTGYDGEDPSLAAPAAAASEPPLSRATTGSYGAVPRASNASGSVTANDANRQADGPRSHVSVSADAEEDASWPAATELPHASAEPFWNGAPDPDEDELFFTASSWSHRLRWVGLALAAAGVGAAIVFIAFRFTRSPSADKAVNPKTAVTSEKPSTVVGAAGASSAASSTTTDREPTSGASPQQPAAVAQVKAAAGAVADAGLADGGSSAASREPADKGASDAVSPYAALVAQARESAAKGRSRQALRLWRQAAAVNATGWEALEQLALAQLDAGRTDRALGLARRAEAAHAVAPYAQLVIGAALQEQGREAEAKAAYQRFVQLCPTCDHAKEIEAILRSL